MGTHIPANPARFAPIVCITLAYLSHAKMTRKIRNVYFDTMTIFVTHVHGQAWDPCGNSICFLNHNQLPVHHVAN